MGFSREQVVEALVHTNSLQQATEYCLTHQQHVAGPAAASAQVLLLSDVSARFKTPAITYLIVCELFKTF